jgi:hypothetical protein
MKERFMFQAPAIISLIVIGLVITSSFGFGQNNREDALKVQIPSDIDKVFTNSCLPCHSDHGKVMAKAMLNFSKWNSYGRRSQIQKSKAICRMIKKGEMPPAQFIESSPELALTKEQKQRICEWVNNTVVKKEK